ncbi:4'-phosphopantetheinyl transferase EntD (siderophore biosynthesis) (EntD) (PDB:4QJK) [Commensalibacter communis]|uniref:4'-phosphopantetheinyl transferase family protein n=1 Tax=Commensalibacter communis TaxID=2972786 RepID=UPI0022FF5761|nr:4'-phosphopantetheinyl transferase superfamily protein [Commensalibacter communis]CAI3954131.1 4'-phosphopantetheinyl transferase EntD (siderophore biosynthesis) (EntD) (PDB:4QJK) [Commensalibacter communis]CAI3954914.1 4'-phosphopantetheinyl transferase EntD (siderophore biosynthesis) (EntD) (PDB:4QJK) [Commensalibacter communis]
MKTIIASFQKKFFYNIELGKIHNDIYYCKLNFNYEEYHDRLFKIYKINYDNSLIKYSIKRQAEYLSGRFCCKIIFDYLNDSNQVLSNHDKSPLWPKGFVGSISHTDKNAIAIMTRNVLCKLGIDIEYFDKKKILNYEHLISNYEMLLLKSHNISYKLSLLISFSAKESLFKALYPQTKIPLYFDKMYIYKIDISNQKFYIRINHIYVGIILPQLEFVGHYILENNLLTTFIIC